MAVEYKQVFAGTVTVGTAVDLVCPAGKKWTMRQLAVLNGGSATDRIARIQIVDGTVEYCWQEAFLANEQKLRDPRFVLEAGQAWRLDTLAPGGGGLRFVIVVIEVDV